jgi:hypothetical protein
MNQSLSHGIQELYQSSINTDHKATITENYEAYPVSKVPWGRLQKQNTISWKYLLQQIQQVLSYFSTYSPSELRHLSYRGTNF